MLGFSFPDSKPCLCRNICILLTWESQTCWLSIMLSLQIRSLRPRGLFTVKRGIQTCSDSHLMSFCVADVHSGLACFLIVSAHFAAVELWHPTWHSSANSSVECSCSRFATKWFCGTQASQGYHSLAMLPFGFTKTHNYLLSSRNTARKAWKEGNLSLILLQSAMESATKPEMKGKSETLSPSPCT